MTARFILPALAATALAVPAAAQPAPAAQAARPSEEAAMGLARLLLPRDLIVKNELRIARQGLEVGFASEPEGKALLETYPKLLDEMWAAAEPEARRYSEAVQPRHENELAELLRTRLSADQVAALSRFYQTPTGRKLLAAMYNNLDGASALEKAAERPTMEFTRSDLADAQQAAAAKAVAQLGPEDEAALGELGRRVELKTMKLIGASIQELALKWANEDGAGFEERIEAMLIKVIERHVAENAPRD